MREFGLIGYPLTHSFSQPWFTEKFRREGRTDCRYTNFPIPAIDDFAGLLRDHPDLEGLNVTIPYKQLVMPYLDIADALPIPACNCIRIRDGKTHGFNTDITGFERSLREGLKPIHKKALILGNGGATEAVRFVLGRLGIAFEVISRTLHPGSTLTYADLDEGSVADHLLIVNTTPLGMYPRTDACPPIPYEAITPRHYLFDLIYNPERTLFLQKGAAQGAVVKNGYDMLLIQAEESWKIWNARD